MRSKGTRLTGAVVGVWIGLVLSAPAASASCVFVPLAESLRTAEVAFTGTVGRLREPGHVALVRVGRIWKGPDMPAQVEVRGGPSAASGAVATSVDFAFTRGEEYLFLLPDAEDFSVTQCSGTTPLDDEVMALEPADARPPIAGATSTTELTELVRLPPLVWIGGAVLLALGAFLMVRRRSVLRGQ